MYICSSFLRNREGKLCQPARISSTIGAVIVCFKNSWVSLSCLDHEPSCFLNLTHCATEAACTQLVTKHKGAGPSMECAGVSIYQPTQEESCKWMLNPSTQQGGNLSLCVRLTVLHFYQQRFIWSTSHLGRSIDEDPWDMFFVSLSSGSTISPLLMTMMIVFTLHRWNHKIKATMFALYQEIV